MEIRDTTYSFHRSKRNKPCDLCRRQRRKCVPGENRCIRCDQMHLDCTYEDVLSSSAEDGENAEEKARMLEEVSEIEQQMLVIKEEMNTVRVAAGLPGLYSFMELESVGSSDGYPHSPSNHSTTTDYNDDGSMPRTMILDGTPNLVCPPSPASSSASTITEYSDDDIPSHNITDSSFSSRRASPPELSPGTSLERPIKRRAHLHFKDDYSAIERLNWKLTLRSSGIRIHTKIHSFQDLVAFALSNFDHMNSEDPVNPLSPSYLQRHNVEKMIVTTPVLTLGNSTITVVMDSLLNHPGPSITDLVRPVLDYEATLTNHLLNAYFACTNLVTPLYHQPTFTRLFRNRNDSGSLSLVNAIAALATTRHCDHVRQLGSQVLSVDIQLRVGEHFARQSRDFLGEVFDEPGFSLMAALGALAQYKLAHLEISQGWLYLNMALQIAEKIRPLYERERNPDDLDGMAEREMFKRTFYFILTTGMRFGFFEDKASSQSPTFKITTALQDARRLGPSTPLPLEDALPVQYYHHLLSLGDYQFDSHFIEMQQVYTRFHGQISVDSCTHIERVLTTWYQRLPLQLKLTPHLFQYLDAAEIAEHEPYTLSLAITYYACWLNVHTHFLPPIGSAAADAVPNRLMVRSLTICVKSANIVTTLATRLHNKFPCYLDPHMLLHACDVHLRTAQARDVRLAAVGQRNLKECLRILKDSVGVGKEAGSRYWEKLGDVMQRELGG
ncbi:hypothetical protein BC938DRAFT_482544, partial [Jimgerdemannia flammicorona]